MRIAVLDDYLGQALQLADWSAIQQRASVTVFREPLAPDQAAQALGAFDAICHLRERMAMPRSLIEALPRLRFMVVTGQEHRSLDLAAARERGIAVSRVLNHSNGRNSTPELAWALLLALARQLPQAAAAMKQGGWQRHSGRALQGRTLGLIGLGRIGRAMVPIAQAFGMQVLAWSPNLRAEDAAAAGARWAAKDELLAASDYVSLHLVLGERSRHSLGARELALMKPDACLINTARAGLIDEAALIEALQTRRIAGAALDVFDPEPLPDEHPLRRLDNAILTPHLGYTVQETLAAFYSGTVQALQAWIDGAPIDLIA